MKQIAWNDEVFINSASVESVSVKLNSSKNDAVSSSSDSDVFQSFLESSPSRKGRV